MRLLRRCVSAGLVSFHGDERPVVVLTEEGARVMRGEIARGPQAYGGAQPGVSPRLNLVVDLAEAEAGRMKDEYVSTEHLLIAIAGETGRSPAAKLLPRALAPTSSTCSRCSRGTARRCSPASAGRDAA